MAVARARRPRPPIPWTIWTPAPAIQAWPYPIADEAVIARMVSRCQPIPAARIRTNSGQMFHTADYRAHLDLLKWTWKGIRRGIPPEAGALGIRCFFFRRTRQTVDRDNLAKPVQDSGNDVIWIDDAQVVEGFDRIFFDPDHPRTEVLVYRVLA